MPGIKAHSNARIRKIGGQTSGKPGRARPDLLRAVSWSVLVHALLLAALTVGLPASGWVNAGPEAGLLLIPGASEALDEAIVALDPAALAALDEATLPPLPPLPALPEADFATQDVRPASSLAGIPGETRAPAPDSGQGQGRNLPVAFRRDASTLRARNSTGANVYQPSREKTSRQSSSREAVRRERKTGVGDSARSEMPRLAEEAPAVPDLPDERLSDEELEPPIEAEARLPLQPGTDVSRGEGPLDAETGQRSFDDQTEGPVRDRLAVRAASNEPSPGLIDYAAVSARGPEAATVVVANRGPAVAPGVTPTPSPGTASAEAGWPEPRRIGGYIGGQGTSEREYSREHLEILRRVSQLQRFPRHLAVRLEQGEAIVQFQVERDGRVWGDVKLLKSAGFDDFDREALEVVRRAAPYPHMARPLLVRLRIAFNNPMIR